METRKSEKYTAKAKNWCAYTSELRLVYQNTLVHLITWWLFFPIFLQRFWFEIIFPRFFLQTAKKICNKVKLNVAHKMELCVKRRENAMVSKCAMCVINPSNTFLFRDWMQTAHLNAIPLDNVNAVNSSEYDNNWFLANSFVGVKLHFKPTDWHKQLASGSCSLFPQTLRAYWPLFLLLLLLDFIENICDSEWFSSGFALNLPKWPRCQIKPHIKFISFIAFKSATKTIAIIERHNTQMSSALMWFVLFFFFGFTVEAILSYFSFEQNRFRNTVLGIWYRRSCIPLPTLFIEEFHEWHRLKQIKMNNAKRSYSLSFCLSLNKLNKRCSFKKIINKNVRWLYYDGP